MNYTDEQVETIVLEVLRRLGVAGGERSSTPAGEANELTLKEPVITLRSIEGRLAGVTRIIVQRRAVVTPAVKDELKKRNIELVREARP